MQLIHAYVLGFYVGTTVWYHFHLFFTHQQPRHLSGRRESTLVIRRVAAISIISLMLSCDSLCVPLLARGVERRPVVRVELEVVEGAIQEIRVGNVPPSEGD